MRVVATVESRMGSTRLPGKNTRKILGRPLLGWLVERLSDARSIDTVCVATTTEPIDDEIERVALAAGAAVHRGSVDDVLGRVLSAARSVNADVIVEITGDCPLSDARIIDAAVARYKRGGYHYVTNVLDELTFPIGFDVQIFSVDLLDEVSRLTADPADRADVTPFIYRNPARYRLLNLRAPAELHRPTYRLCVDYPEDLDVVASVVESLYPANPAFGASDIVRLLDARPDLVRHNTQRNGLFAHPSSGGAADQELLPVEANVR
jgi:spore coat polysaccharide biosynthesis protein SpsF